MATNPKIKADIQKLLLDDDEVSLFTIDGSRYGAPIYNITTSSDAGANIFFNGVEYFNIQAKITGLKRSADQRPARPIFSVSNVLGTFSAFCKEFEDGIGAKVTRIKTFAKYLDAHSDADSAAMMPRDIFWIEKKIKQNKFEIEWELATPIDVGNRMIPRIQITRYCRFHYRQYVDGVFVYTNATCPYTGTGYFLPDGTVTTEANDVCGLKFSDCERRYPLATDQLPFGGVPNAGAIGGNYR